MKIIFLKDVKKQGKKDEIKEVKNGFGEFLINSGNAVLYSSKSAQILNNQKENRKEEEIKKEEEAIKFKKSLENVTLKFKVKTGEKDKVFGNVSSKQINEELIKLGFKIDKKKIIINYPLNNLGIYEVSIEIYKKIIANVKVELHK